MRFFQAIVQMKANRNFKRTPFFCNILNMVQKKKVIGHMNTSLHKFRDVLMCPGDYVVICLMLKS